MTIGTAVPAAAIIDLSPYFNYANTPKPGRVLVGRENGAKVREATRFDEIVNKHKDNGVDVVLPAMTMSVNPSFLEEFIKNAVNELGSAMFKQVVTFKGPDMYNIKNDLDEAIDRVSRLKLA